VIPDWITAVVAFAALLLSVYNTIMQRRDRYPRLRVTTDTRGIPQTFDTAWSCRVVNEGTGPATIRAVRIFYGGGFMDRFGRGSSIPFPPPSEPMVDRSLLENEVRLPREDETPGEKVLPRDLQPTQSVRFVTNEVRLHELLARTGPRGPNSVVTFRIGVLDHRDRWHTSARVREVVVPDPEKPVP
jgi:hypothetical protein